MAIDLVIVAQSDEINVLTSLLKTSVDKEEFNVAFTTTSFEYAENKLKAITKPIVLIRGKDLRSTETKNFMEFLNEYGIKYICICRETSESFEMLRLGASDMIIKKDGDLNDKKSLFVNMLKSKIKQAHQSYFKNISRILKHEFTSLNKIIVMGSSTGGTETILSILKEMPEDAPPILIVQHMPPVFTRLYAERLHNVTKLSVWEGHDGDEIKRGLAIVAPGDFQMSIKEKDNRFFVECAKGGLVNGHCPSVDVLFYSAAKVLGDRAVGVILTGMGADGAKGLLEMRKKGAITLGQDEESSIVYGMPKAAFELGAVYKQCSIKDMTRCILEAACR